MYNIAQKYMLSTIVRAPEDGKGIVQTTEEIRATGERMDSLAAALAGLEKEDTSEALERVMKAKEDWQGGPISVMFALRNDMGDRFDDLPEPDSETGNNPDKYKHVTIGADGKSKTKTTSFFVEFVDNLREGKAIKDELDFLRRAGNAEANKDGIPESILAMNPQQRERRKGYLDGRRANLRNTVKKAVSLAYQLAAVDELPHCAVTFAWKDETETEVENTTKPIIVTNPKAPLQQWEQFTVGSFLKLDAKVAAENGGTLAALKATIGREGNGGQGQTGDNARKVPPVKTFEMLDIQLSNAASYLDEIWNDPKRTEYGAFLKRLSGAGSDATLRTLGDLKAMLDDVFRMDKFAARYAKLVEEDGGSREAA